MNENHTIGLSLLDCVPNLAFLFSSLFLICWTRKSGNRFGILTMTIGAFLVLMGGTTKAIWKLIYTLGIKDIELLGEAQFILLAPGFLLMFLSALSMAKRSSGPRKLSAIAVWKVPLLAVMTISNLGLLVTLGYIAYRQSKKAAVIFFGISLACMLVMAGMATADQSIMQQWIEEIVNSLGQIAFAFGSFQIHRNQN